MRAIYSSIINVMFTNTSNFDNSIPVNIAGRQRVDFGIIERAPQSGVASALPGAWRNFDGHVRLYVADLNSPLGDGASRFNASRTLSHTPTGTVSAPGAPRP